MKTDKTINENDVEVHQVSALTKPDPNCIVDGVCTKCKETVEDADSHVCSKTISTEITDLTEMVTSIEQFKNKYTTNENINSSDIVNILSKYTAYLSKHNLLSNVMFDARMTINNFLENK